MLGTTRQDTTSLQVGALTLGMAYRLGNNMSLNGNFEFGVTAAAPDMRAVVSLPTISARRKRAAKRTILYRPKRRRRSPDKG